MRVCKHTGCNTTIGQEWIFCPDHRYTDYAYEYRKLNGLNQP